MRNPTREVNWQRPASHGVGTYLSGMGVLLCLVAALLGMMSGPQPLKAQAVPLRGSLQISLALRVLEFDRGRSTQDREGIVVGVVFQQGYRASLLLEREVAAAIERLEEEGTPVRMISIPVDDTDLSAALLGDTSFDLIYVAPLRAHSIDRITDLSRSEDIITMTGVEEYVERGISVGITSRGARPEILVNLEAARHEGADFSSELLKLTRIVEGL